ncbi:MULTISPECIES: Gfo/Idh/MocA family protein [unclassified Aureimonas]|uniref:Gfo/Idh/MocA family protein n=1 Tax=unclassified Aureimonas TaxID=2615206 RepID=UPI0006F64349|nr:MULTISPECIES: Gfo/Idh/MocA family oxidoreductase [unclassified Aureimonas]KQT69652.1 oxidoreductase [Aureimonas sp. Leaf427]KQT76194.1 oxidoreductase [Aureimonas sp. Leaf460]
MIEGKTTGRSRRIRLGMVGGGQDAFIGAVHRIASRIDDRYELVAGALSSTPERAARSAAAIGLDPERSYPDFQTMATAEAARADGIEAVAIVTPNHVHIPAAKAFLEAGIHVICDKPLATSLEEGRSLEEVLARSGGVFALTHNYTGYPLVRQARAMVEAGELGRIRIVQVEYPQDWLAEKIEETGHKQAEWRADPARSGAGGCIGDIGTHAFNLAEFVTAGTVREVCAEMTTFVEGRRLDDDIQILLRFDGGAKGFLWASQVAPGHENGLKIRVYGEKAAIEWVQADPNRMIFSPLGGNQEIVTRNGPGANAANKRVSRIPAGHPEGYLEGFANLYTEIADAIAAAQAGMAPPPDVIYPTLADGLRGLSFIEASIRSSKAGGVWTAI